MIIKIYFDFIEAAVFKFLVVLYWYFKFDKRSAQNKRLSKTNC